MSAFTLNIISLLVLATFSLLTFIFIGILFVDFINFLRKYAPFLPSKDEDFTHIYRFLDKNDNYKIADLGSGDARVLIHLAKNTNAQLSGYEINPFMSLVSKIKVKLAKMQKKIDIYNENFLSSDFSQYDLFYIYGIGKVIPEVETKLLEEAEEGTYVVSNKFTFDKLQHVVTSNNLHLYKI